VHKSRLSHSSPTLQRIPLVCIPVMRGLVPRIHAFLAAAKAWMAGTSPAMTSSDSFRSEQTLADGLRDIQQEPLFAPPPD
jgi:hypothetical protein